MVSEVDRLNPANTAGDSLIFTIEEFFPCSVRDRHLEVFGDEEPLLFLKGYVAAEVHSLYGPKSSEDANLNRVAAGLERGAVMLNELARQLRRRSKNHI